LDLDGNFLSKNKFITFAKRSTFTYLWRIRFLDPLIFGEYPHSMKKLVGERLPEISSTISKFLAGSFDFVGINHYTTLYARNDRTHIRKLILQDASSDAAVIATRKMSKNNLKTMYM
jgi:beta-glucosidase/6-phospho-beta-glucosidase/beta-galactosidase